MKLKLRPDSILASLTEPQLADLYDWILSRNTYADVQTRATQPVAEGGLGLNIHITTLQRFYASYTAWLRAKEIADGEREALSSPSDLHASAATELAHAVYDLSRGPLKQPELKLVAKYLQQQRDHALKFEYLKIAQHHANLATQKQVLAEDRLVEDKRQWEFIAAREVMKELVAYEEIHERTDIDDIDKIWKARENLFGAEAVAAIDRQARQFQERLAASKNAAGCAPAPGAPFGAPPNVPPTAAQSTQLHAAPEIPRPASEPNPEQVGRRSPLRAVAVPEQRLPAASVPDTFDTLSAGNSKTEQSKVQSPDSPHNPDTLVNTSSHSGREPALQPVLQNFSDGGSFSEGGPALHSFSEGGPVSRPASESAPSVSELKTQDSGLSAGAQRSTAPKTPAAWLASARHPSDLRRHFFAQYCGHSVPRLNAFLVSTEPLDIPLKVLNSFDELP